ncbi:hypothetical protein GCM10027298_21540 [Epidermidibacterium keratini]
MAPDGIVRLQTVAGRDAVTAWALVLGVLVRREFSGVLDGAGDISVPASALHTRVEASVSSSEYVELPDSVDAQWRATLPPTSGWTPREDLPVSDVIETLEFAGSQLRGLDDAALDGVGDSMLGQTIVMVDRDGPEPVEIPMRLMLAMSRLGFFAGAQEPGAGVVRIATKGAWTVAATLHGAAFRKAASIDLLGLS